MTGGNGWLGRWLVLDWLERLAPNGGKVYALIRGADAEAARARLDAVYESGDPKLSAHYRQLAQQSLEVIAGDFGDQDLGLSQEVWQKLAKDVDLIVHSGALVNHVLPYSQLFGPNVAGTAEIIKLAISERLAGHLPVDGGHRRPDSGDGVRGRLRCSCDVGRAPDQ